MVVSRHYLQSIINIIGMKLHLLKEFESGSKIGLIKKKIITHYIYNGCSTITDLSKELDLSVPTVTKFIGEMSEDGYIKDFGKLETSGGRHPNLYGLNPESGYFIGVDIKKFELNIGMFFLKFLYRGNSFIYIIG